MTYDVVLVGGGLSNGLIMLALVHASPRGRIAIVEQDEKLGGNHHWSFHAADVPDAAWPWFEPLVAHRWPSYDVRFPTFERRVDSPYATVTSATLDAAVRRAADQAGATVILGHRVTSVQADHVTLDDGTRLVGNLVVDARGPAAPGKAGLAYQKFLGLTLRVAGDIPARPIVMDACVPQEHGLRFVYVLPLGGDRVLIEDTYYDESPVLDRTPLRANVLDYARAQGLAVIDVLGSEHGVLPLPLERTMTPRMARPLIAGYAGGWLQPTTGYSLPVAVRLALALASADPDTAVADLAARHSEQAVFLRRLNRWLFRGIAPEHRWRLFAKFYHLPNDVVARFYAMELGPLERWRIVAGVPPRGMRVRELLRAVGDA